MMVTCWCGKRFKTFGGNQIGPNTYTVKVAVCNDCDVVVTSNCYAQTIQEAVEDWLYQTWPVLIKG